MASKHKRKVKKKMKKSKKPISNESKVENNLDEVE